MEHLKTDFNKIFMKKNKFLHRGLMITKTRGDLLKKILKLINIKYYSISNQYSTSYSRKGFGNGFISKVDRSIFLNKYHNCGPDPG